MPHNQTELAESYGITKQTMNNYMSMTSMIPELEDLVDTGIVTKDINLDKRRKDMGNILDKLGIYDLFVIFLSGAIITYITSFIWNIFSKEKFPFSIDETMTFLVISMVIGMIFQEMGSLIYKFILNKKRRLLKNIFAKITDDTSTSLIEKEKEEIKLYFKKINISDIEMMYIYCKYKLLDAGINVNGDKNQSISALSRSLALYFTGLSGVLSIKNFLECNGYYFNCLIVCILLAALFYRRCIRFIKVRYVYILRMFYYKYILDIKTTQQRTGKH